MAGTALVPPLDASAGPKSGTSTSRVTVRVRFAETDLMGIVHHASYLLYVEEARVEYLRRRGANYAEWVARDMHFPVIDARLRYRAAAVFGDDLAVEVWIGQATRVSVRFDYRIFRVGSAGGPTAEPTLLAEGYTTLACVDGGRSPRRIPPEILEQILGPELAAAV